MAVYEVPRQPDHGPYSATIGTDGGYLHGFIRIEPPFEPGPAVMGYGVGDGVDVEHLITSKEATLLQYQLMEDYADGTEEENRARVESEAEFILSNLGQAASKDVFTEYWNQFKR